MYTKQQAAKQREAFWTAFGQYMRPVLSADGEKINWVNYKTGIHGIQFRMDAGREHAVISIVIAPGDPALQHACYGQFLLLKNIFDEVLGEEWQWQPDAEDEHGRQIAKISRELANVSIFKNEDWPALISFFKTRIVALDEFWSGARYSFTGIA